MTSKRSAGSLPSVSTWNMVRWGTCTTTLLPVTKGSSPSMLTRNWPDCTTKKISLSGYISRLDFSPGAIWMKVPVKFLSWTTVWCQRGSPLWAARSSPSRQSGLLGNIQGVSGSGRGAREYFRTRGGAAAAAAPRPAAAGGAGVCARAAPASSSMAKVAITDRMAYLTPCYFYPPWGGHPFRATGPAVTGRYWFARWQRLKYLIGL